MEQIFLLALVISLASALAIIFRRFHQPMVVSYLAVGALLSAFGVIKAEQLTFLSFLPEIGLAFLLFLVGMELDLREFRTLGKNVLTASLVQVLTTSVFLSFLLVKTGLSLNSALLIAFAVSFSSTILVIKLLLEGQEQASLHGKLAIGILLLEDLLAVLGLMLLAVLGGQVLFTPMLIATVIGKGIILIWWALFSGRRLLPELFRQSSSSPELLFATAIGWCLLFVSLAQFLGFSLGIGAFLAGVSLAQSVFRLQISAKIKPLRDFFIMIFFLNLGTGLSVSSLSGSWNLALLLLFYAILAKPVVFFTTFILLRFRAHTAFQTGILLSSVSEFSLILLALAGKLGLVGKEVVSAAIFATVFSFISSAFLITHRAAIYARLKNLLKRAERPGLLGHAFLPAEKEFKDHAVLIGCHRSGKIILAALKKIYEDNLIVIDFNPEVVEELKSQFVPTIFGDIADPEITERLNLKEAKLVISTVRDLPDNLALLDALEKTQSQAAVIATASDAKEAVVLYERGAHHVSLPMALEGTMISHLLYQYQDHLPALAKERERKLGELKRASTLQ